MNARRRASILTLAVTACVAAICISSANAGQILRVPSVYPTIQTAIDDANDGDWVLVAPGTYMEAVKMKAGVDLIGNGPADTILTAEQTNAVVRGADNCRLDGFTIIGDIHEDIDGVFCHDVNDFTISSNVIRNCTWSGISAVRSTITIRNNVIYGSRCAGVFLTYPAANRSVIVNNTIWNNANEADITIWLGASALVVNNILQDLDCDEASLAEIRFNDIANQPAMGDNIQADPLFADPNAGDFHLKSRTGRWDPNTQGWVRDDLTSPCIDAGDPNSLIGEEPEPNGGRVNMGAYGGTREASKSQGRILYVDDDAPGNGTGTTWERAYRDLQAALDVAQAGDEIRVASGIYRPSKGMLVSASNRHASFSLISGVAIRGGFAGAAGADPNARDVAWFESILSGDFEGDEGGVKNGSYNCFHVVRGDNVDATAVLDGFTIEGGVADQLPPVDDGGGGLTISQGSPTILNCTFRRNSARNRGGAVATYQSQGTFIDCTFIENMSSYTGGAVESNASELQFTGCAFIRNTVDTRVPGGGAVYTIGRSHCRFTRCRFVENVASYGGAVRNEDSIAVFQNCLFFGNRALYYRFSLSAPGSLRIAGLPGSGGPDVRTLRRKDGVGGAIYSAGGSILTLDSCTVVDNYADMWGGIWNWPDCSCEVTNCIVWGNSDVYNAAGSQQIRGDIVTARYCCVQDLPDSLAGVGNIDSDPAFARSGRWVDSSDPTQDIGPRYMATQWIDGDYHLQSQSGRWDPDRVEWVADDLTSPCIDAGDPDAPFGVEPQPNGGRINMGVYGGTGEASKSYNDQ